MANKVILPFSAELARGIKNKDIEGKFLFSDGFKEEWMPAELVYDEKGSEEPFLFVYKDGPECNSIWFNEEGEFKGYKIKIEADAEKLFKKGDILVDSIGRPFIFNGEMRDGGIGVMCLLWNNDTPMAYERDDVFLDVERDGEYIRFASEEEKVLFADKMMDGNEFCREVARKYLSKYIEDYEFKPFDKVLIRDEQEDPWVISFFGRNIEYKLGERIVHKYECLNGITITYCIPYEGNEHLLGKK